MPAYAERGVVRRASDASICDAVRVRHLGASMAKMAASTLPTITLRGGERTQQPAAARARASAAAQRTK